MRAIVLFLMLAGLQAHGSAEMPISVSGIYPHLAVFNAEKAGECGIGAVVPWAGKLWMITYPPHERTGGDDKLYEIAPDMSVSIRPESVGGTHAGRMIHRESNQLIIGPYFISADGKVRVVDLHKLTGRMTAIARHLTDPANMVYYYDMEGPVYEVNVHTLEVTKLFEKPVPGWHGKGAYTAQGRLIVANNGEDPAMDGLDKAKFTADLKAYGPEDAGVLAEWDGKTWKIIERRKFTDITGPGGIEGAPDDNAPAWAIGWDKRSVMLKLLDHGEWSTFRLPKASHSYDPTHGWYTEWPRIREAAPGHWMMDMHAMFYDFPQGFCAAQTGGIKPIASHLRYIPDFCNWNGRLVLAADDTSIMQNPMAGRSQSNLWFGKFEDLTTFGPRIGWGGPWMRDSVKANTPSTPFLINGFTHRVAHIVNHIAFPVVFTLETDKVGDAHWSVYKKITVPAGEYLYHIFPHGFLSTWLQVKTDRDCVATFYLHESAPRDRSKDAEGIFQSLAGVKDRALAGLIRPSSQNKNLQMATSNGYYEVDEKLQIAQGSSDLSDEVQKSAPIKSDFEVDTASVIMTQNGKRYRLPKTVPQYDRPFTFGWPRAIRECVSERYLANICGTFYEIPRDDGMPLIRPIATHLRQISDFCTWRGLMVLKGVKSGAKPDGHCFTSEDGKAGAWFGAIDDLWKLGKPVGHGGPWKDSTVVAHEPSDPYLMTGYDRKSLTISHNAKESVTFTVEVDIDHNGWHRYGSITVPAGKSLTHHFPEGYSAHWVRLISDTDCSATAAFLYE